MSSTADILARLKAKKQEYSRTNASVVKLKEGKTKVRFFIDPKLANEDHIFGERDLGVHWIKMSEKAKPVAVLGCREICYGEPSLINPILEQAADAAVDDETLAILKDMKARKVVLVNAVIRDGVDKSDYPQILELTPTTFGSVCAAYETYISEGVEDALDPQTGIDLIIERQGKGLDTKYTVMVAPKSQPLVDDAIEKSHDLDAYIAQEYFKGEERKAIHAISTLVGKELGGPLLTGPASSKTSAMLTAAKPIEAPKPAVVETPKEKPAPPKTVAKPVETPKPDPEPEIIDDDEAALQRQLEEIRAKKAAAAKAAQKAAVTPPPAPEVVADEFNKELGMDELDAALAELDGL